MLVLLLAPPAQADYKDAFKKGIDAYDRKRWAEVVKHMRDAILENPAEGERIKLYGLRFEVYFPHFYLGAAYLNQGLCDQAVEAFKASESQGAIRPSPRYAELVDGLKSCERVAPRTPPSTVSLPLPTPPPSTAAPAPPATPPPTLPTPSPVPDPTPASAPVSSPVPSRRAPPGDLLSGARAYFDGQYERAVALLARPAATRGRAAAQSLLLRSAARYALFKVGGETQEELRRLAALDAAASRQADATLQPDREAFSPEFVDFFRTSR